MAIVNIHLCEKCNTKMKEIDTSYDIVYFRKYVTYLCPDCKTTKTKVFDVTPEDVINLWATKNREASKTTITDVIKEVIKDAKRKTSVSDNDEQWDDPDDEIINR